MRYLLLLSLVVLFVACGDDLEKKGDSSNNVSNNANNTNNGSNSSNHATNGTNNANNSNGSNNSNNGTNANLECYEDQDGDGWGFRSIFTDGTCADEGLAAEGGDCDDRDPDISPDASDICDGEDRNCGGDWDVSVPTTCATIQEALDVAAAEGIRGTISVEPGTYRENIVFGGARVTLEGAGPDSIIDGSDQDEPTVRFQDGEGEFSVLEGFTITGGSGHDNAGDREGGGIYINEASPTLRNLVIRDNEARGDSGYGGGIHLEDSLSVVEDVLVVGNRSQYYGGGIHVLGGSPEFLRLRVFSNASLYGGGIADYFSTASFEG